MMTVGRGTLRDARVTRGALPVAESARQPCAERVAILLVVRVVAGHARHPAVEVAVAVLLPFLVGEGPDPAVGCEGTVAEQGELCRVVVRERIAGEKSLAKLVFHRVALVAHARRRVLAEGSQCDEADVAAIATREGATGCELHVSAAGPVAALAVDREGGECGAIGLFERALREKSLRSVAALAVGEARIVAEHPGGGPVAALLDAHGGDDRRPSLPAAGVGVAEPSGGLARPLEREQAQGAVVAFREITLGAAAVDVAPADHAGDREGDGRFTGLLDEKLVHGRADARRHARVRKTDGAGEWRDHGGGGRRSSRSAVGGRLP